MLKIVAKIVKLYQELFKQQKQNTLDEYRAKRREVIEKNDKVEEGGIEKRGGGRMMGTFRRTGV
jgi:hypothetical protein